MAWPGRGCRRPRVFPAPCCPLTPARLSAARSLARSSSRAGCASADRSLEDVLPPSRIVTIRLSDPRMDCDKQGAAEEGGGAADRAAPSGECARSRRSPPPAHATPRLPPSPGPLPPGYLTSAACWRKGGIWAQENPDSVQTWWRITPLPDGTAYVQAGRSARMPALAAASERDPAQAPPLTCRQDANLRTLMPSPPCPACSRKRAWRMAAQSAAHTLPPRAAAAASAATASRWRAAAAASKGCRGPAQPAGTAPAPSR